MRKRIKKYLLISLGLLSVLLGVIGVILPILPTTPFLILALACFAKSSPRFHKILLHNRWFGGALQQWEARRTISHTSKYKAMILIVLTFLVSILILNGKGYLQAGLGVLGCVLLVFMWRLKEDSVSVVSGKKVVDTKECV